MNYSKIKKFMGQFMDPCNYAIYKKDQNRKFVFRVRTRTKLLEWFAKGKGYVSPDQSSWMEHCKKESDLRIGYTNNYTKDTWLIMIDLDTDKSDPNRLQQLYDSADKLKKIFGPNLYFENSSYSGDLHAYLLVHGMKSCNTKLANKAIWNAFKNIGKDLPLKKLEVMGLAAIYQYNYCNKLKRKIVTKVNYSGLIAKVPRCLLNGQFSKLENTANVHFRMLFELSGIGNHHIHGGQNPAVRIGCQSPANPSYFSSSPPVVNTQDVSGIPLLAGKYQTSELDVGSLTQTNISNFENLWDLNCQEDKFVITQDINTKNGKIYTENRYITKQQFAHYSIAWMLCITRYDKHIEGRLPEHQSTVNYQEVNKEYQNITGKKSWDKHRIWVMQQLFNVGVIIMRNGAWSEGISRKFGWSWGKLHAIIESGCKAKFEPLLKKESKHV